MRWRLACVLAASAAALLAQTPPATILEIEFDKYVVYYDDVADPSKLGTSPAMVALAPNFNWVFKWFFGIGDIVAVNGKPAKGMRVARGFPPRYTTTYTPGKAIADVTGNCVSDWHYTILRPDGTSVGTISLIGLGSTSWFGGTSHNTVVGGTGAFVGARGYMLLGGTTTTPTRSASMAEDPANRRVHGGGKRSERIYLIPMTWPEVISTTAGPVAHHAADWSPINSASPARAGEWVIMSVSGLGPTKPSIDPGKPFPLYGEPLCLVNSPVEATVNGKPTQTANTVGWPETQGIYRVDVLIPTDITPGLATVGISAAWINGPEVKIPVR